MVSPEILHNLARLKPELRSRWGVKRIGCFDVYLDKHRSFDCELNILVELERPLGWEFFAMKEWVQLKLRMPIDICTENSIKPDLKKKIFANIQFV
ncbi:MAG: hypothetical protein ACK4WD_04610 [Flavobacteriales bacterium]|jgi:predicted nucleotidyltransferase